MTIKSITCETLGEAISKLEKCAYENASYIFRGHKSSTFKLQSSHFRYFKSHRLSIDMTIMLDHFKHGLIRQGLASPELEHELDWMQYARHFGMPSPLIDFTHSPYIALFFAFNCLRNADPSDDYVSVLAIRVGEIGKCVAEKRCMLVEEDKKEKVFHDAYKEFMMLNKENMKGFFLYDTIAFIPYPSAFNKRMIIQQGCMLYDATNYEEGRYKDLEDFIENIQEKDIVLPDGTIEKPEETMIKILINKKCARELFERLELMGINGGGLFRNEEGVIMDVENTYYYNPRASYLI